MNICVLGAGYVGLTTTAVLAELGHNLICVDKSLEKIKQLQKQELPIFEPGLGELLIKNERKIKFTTESDKAISECDIIFITVGTPSAEGGAPDLSYIEAVIDDLAKNITSYKTIITKSTVPPGTNEYIIEMLVDKGVKRDLFAVVSNPEFLREGSAVYDMFHADRTVAGLQKTDTKSLQILKAIYNGLDAPFIATTLTGAEMIKYANNAFLAMKVSFINEMARICEAYGADVRDVAKGIGMDRRIGAEFLQAGIGFGGSCFPKDLQALQYAAVSKEITASILEAVQTVNDTQLELYIKKMKTALKGLTGKKAAVLGISFKPNTDDTRYSKAVAFIAKLIENGCHVHAYDPQALLPAELSGKAVQVKSVADCVDRADCLVVATEWPEFMKLDWSRVKEQMKGTLIVDGRNCLDSNSLEKLGFHCMGVGTG
ncbi:UDP-glucose/GDP-mannose dehydrogenase family protein [Bacillus sp. V3-13]|uniref:UDP-glucose dehydrogenase family protein n=1 Tax=Bacillus sp. V3-13 TaxID=2053728 RepID=UPI000C788875|nr:UDP-glucose/GDP-mannose dehydrogenase family protein [Bacillus sp. V3-13]PLR76073.1 UDP-glucose/GDP-mannose dehydrogenase family protein [Bacillus sp. V3-13]